MKFFRKIRFNLIENKVTGKYLKYAIGEVVLVMIGILLALQVSNWNQSRSNGNIEKKYLESLRKEFQENEKNLNQSLTNIDLKMTNLKILIEACVDAPKT